MMIHRFRGSIFLGQTPGRWKIMQGMLVRIGVTWWSKANSNPTRWKNAAPMGAVEYWGDPETIPSCPRVWSQLWLLVNTVCAIVNNSGISWLVEIKWNKYDILTIENGNLIRYSWGYTYIYMYKYIMGFTTNCSKKLDYIYIYTQIILEDAPTIFKVIQYSVSNLFTVADADISNYLERDTVSEIWTELQILDGPSNSSVSSQWFVNTSLDLCLGHSKRPLGEYFKWIEPKIQIPGLGLNMGPDHIALFFSLRCTWQPPEPQESSGTLPPSTIRYVFVFGWPAMDFSWYSLVN